MSLSLLEADRFWLFVAFLVSPVLRFFALLDLLADFGLVALAFACCFVEPFALALAI
jgi:hypothetical protein